MPTLREQEKRLLHVFWETGKECFLIRARAMTRRRQEQERAIDAAYFEQRLAVITAVEQEARTIKNRLEGK